MTGTTKPSVVVLGGHSIPEATVRRRYAAGLRNFFTLYQPLSSTWGFFDNSDPSGMELIASGWWSTIARVARRNVWEGILADYDRR